MKLTLKELRTIVKRVIAEGEKPDSGPFSVGDPVLSGKYKNKKGKIKKIFKDDKDHVAVEIEPTPKGRKKNIETGLYKIWPGEETNEE